MIPDYQSVTSSNSMGSARPTPDPGKQIPDLYFATAMILELGACIAGVAFLTSDDLTVALGGGVVAAVSLLLFALTFFKQLDNDRKIVA